MAMALSLFWREGLLMLVAAYENGLAMVAQLGRDQSWGVVYKAQSHTQPILSIDVPPSRTYFLTSGADSIIAKHPIPNAAMPTQESPKTRVRPPSGTSEPKPQGSPVTPIPSSATNSQGNPPSLLSSALASRSGLPNLPQQMAEAEAGAGAGAPIETTPLKIVNTKHSGQQGLRIRSDGKIFATAGWDSKLRVYSIKTLSELAVLKWHGVSCYTIAFAVVDGDDGGGGGSNFSAGSERSAGEDKHTNDESEDREHLPVQEGVVPRIGELSVKDRRIKQAKEAHWLAAGSNDGKISLWDIY